MAGSGASAMLERVLDDDLLHEQLSTAGSRLTAAYRRTRAMRAQEAAQDKKLYEHVREAAGALTAAARRALGKPEPKPPRRAPRRLAALAIGLSVVALVRSMHRAQQAASPPPAA
jgi:hypothetical protein